MRFRDNPYMQLFQFTSYRRFWSGFALSTLGDSMARVALVWFVLQETDSARAVGILTLSYTAPILVGGLVAGYLLDRFDRRWVMAVDNAVRGLAMAAVPLLHFLGMLEVWHAYVAAAVFGSLMMISLAGSPALIPSIIPRDQLTAANAFETLGFSMTSVIGPPLAGVLIALIGAPNVLIIDAASYFAFALALVGVRYLDQPGEVAGSAVPLRGSTSLGDAVRLLRSNQILLTTTLMYMAVNVGFGATRVWLPIYVERILDGDASLFGLLLGVGAAGQTVSSIVAVGINRWLPLGTLICLAGFLGGLATLPLLAGQTGLALVALFLSGALTAPLTIWAQTLRMEIIPAAMRGRTFALLRMMMQGSQPLGGALGGFLLPAVGISAMIGLTTAVISGASAVAFRVRALRFAGPPTPPTSVQPDPVILD
jgi:MFS family permease